MNLPFLPPFGTVPGEYARAGLVLAAILALFATAELWARRAHPPVEWTRKLVHMGSGIVAAAFPWLFSTAWTVAVLSLLMLATLWVARRARLLESVTGVERESSGEALYPVGVAILFAVGRGNPVFYLIALGSLVLSDTTAALLGQAYGRVGFDVHGTRKSVEGSVAFFTATFIVVHLMLLLATSMDRTASVLVALQIATLVTCFEAISARGSDNLFVPLGTYFLLVKMTPKPPADAAWQLGWQLAILAFTLVVARLSRLLTASGAIAAHLVLYATFSLGYRTWVFVPLAAFGGFLELNRRYQHEPLAPRGGYQVQAIYYVSIVSLLCILADNVFATFVSHPTLSGGHPFFPLFLGALASPLACFALEMRHTRRALRRRPPAQRLLAPLGYSAGLVLPVGLLVLGRAATLEGASIALLVTGIGYGLYALLRRRLPFGGGVPGSLRLGAFSTLVAVLLALPVHALWAGYALRNLP